MEVIIGSDHAGFPLKEIVKKYLIEKGIKVNDMGTYSTERCDYPDFAEKVAREVVKTGKKGILVCGSGIGISIAANKINGVRCALCHDHYTAVMCRRHNDANIIAFGARVIGSDIATDMVDVFLSTPFDGMQHTARVEKIHKLEQNH
ncbi:ribose 5-phosphate isomerase B, putative [Entamoeba histolytica HM-1:IMSS-B]|uniref:Ribose 5-phosphate isomerase, putative n=6 Tax=Entamoeba histolytica TaxID=5759 RepID=C4MB22_ENTH1|nr:ribose 5-phosphate isomerase, putative [Entamoeba histolytica HM-1:IMSS]EMD47014.1 ribose 5-phosphate isomerase, putative [Entamoeba histolytica KU27]EMH72602.1 ribose 5-phosphate isomerase B, putative [Entamoeba histolytica HM-1:IMSS-B]EMS16937.1 ribose 5-phosphate isomerase [Entamoeba histolytica HM-3:IMSS]ENY63085.1 ribose 5-phosphate isomerase, putative [Entamoeba histolytica HM-1:IMSS-A]GAT99087.1 ribose 5-phosphate isomerase putative [Entamoeba histolytica]|eukprot:XP_651609.1 ribose 5-phosphate isomerase, putative [Entamoeba histolytica HM-1:IMSS]